MVELRRVLDGCASSVEKPSYQRYERCLGAGYCIFASPDVKIWSENALRSQACLRTGSSVWQPYRNYRGEGEAMDIPNKEYGRMRES